MSYARRVNELMMGCLFATGEPTDKAVMVESVLLRAGFHPERLAAAKPEIEKLIREIVADPFLKGKGDGMSFLALAEDRDGNQWGEHRDMDALVALSLATGFASFKLPRDFWPILPGGMPYIMFTLP